MKINVLTEKTVRVDSYLLEANEMMRRAKEEVQSKKLELVLLDEHGLW